MPYPSSNSPHEKKRFFFGPIGRWDIEKKYEFSDTSSYVGRTRSRDTASSAGLTGLVYVNPPLREPPSTRPGGQDYVSSTRQTPSNYYFMFWGCLTIINHQSSMINDQWSIVNHQSSIINHLREFALCYSRNPGPWCVGSRFGRPTIYVHDFGRVRCVSGSCPLDIGVDVKKSYFFIQYQVNE